MNKKLLLVVAALLMVVMITPAAFAAINDQQKEEINKIYQQMNDLRKQIIDRYVEAGELTTEQGKAMKDNLDNMQKYQSENGVVPGAHCGGGGVGTGAGYGMMGGSGAGYGGMMGGYGGVY